MSTKKVVVFWQRVACDYRKEFFLLLKQALAQINIKLILISGQAWPNEGLIDIGDELSFSIRNYNRRLFKKLYWPSGVFKVAKKANLVICEQANSSLLNYLLILRRNILGSPKVAFFGHGINWQQGRNNGLKLKDKFKLFWTKQSDWFFAYTQKSSDLLIDYGYPSKRLTTVNNAIDTKTIRETRQSLKKEQINSLRRNLFPKANSNDVVGVYCGRFTKEKLIPFLLKSIYLIHEKMPNFKMIIIGDGIYREQVKHFCQQHRWCVWLGAKYGQEKLKYLALGDIWLHPGMVGLAILDAFASGLPLATTDNRIHSPEIAYLKPGINGLLTPFLEADFATEVVALLKDREKLLQMQQSALAESNFYTVEKMVSNFVSGIKSCFACH